MILHPGIIGLISGSAITLLMMIYATVIGIIIFARWDFSSSSSYQLSLERKTYLISTLVNWVLGFQIVSTVLFVYTMDDIHELFVGAMCATGSLNANPIGWYALLVKICVLFLAGFWLALNYIDQSLEEYPFVRLKYGLLVGLLPFIILDLVLQLVYFLGLDPAIITSCCGSLFGNDSVAAIASVSALPVGPAMITFYIVCGLYLCSSWLIITCKSAMLRYLYCCIVAMFFVVSIASIISFVSIYIYELPTHHCPFDMLQGWYDYIGYPIYLTLFLGTYFGLLPGIFQPLKRYAGVSEIISKKEKIWVYWSSGSAVCFACLVTYAVCFSNLNYFSG
ncbi:MAG: hypothetical protein ACI8ZB_003664 [Desulforhopalus sp.]|jgi:hypothetical protein